MPAAVTPFDERGRVDGASLARLFAWFCASGCGGVVVAGTTGEGPSLSAVERRDLIRLAVELAWPEAEVWLGVATPSLDEAKWLCRQAATAGASGVLLMGPYYFRGASPTGIQAWYRAVLDASSVPVLLYNFPQMSGAAVDPSFIHEIVSHPQLAGIKDSSGERENLTAYRNIFLPEHRLYVGDETLLVEALGLGWTGTISGAANVIAPWLSRALTHTTQAGREVTAELYAPILAELRRGPQPALAKALLAKWGILSRPDPRLPLEVADAARGQAVDAMLRDRLGNPLQAVTR